MHTDRLALPLLAAAQAQKEVTLNEALALIDGAVQAVVEDIAPMSVPATPVPGQCWIVGGGATGVWTGRDGALAIWTVGGWRFIAPFDGMAVWNLAAGMQARRTLGTWETGAITATGIFVNGDQVIGARTAAIPDPTGGAVVDDQSRTAVVQILGALRTHGLIEM